MTAAKGLLSHACIADAAPEDVDEEDRVLERAARRAILRAETASPVRGIDDDIWVTSAFEFYVGGLRFAPGTYALKRLKQEAKEHAF